jgi:putative acetyltransferase
MVMTPHPDEVIAPAWTIRPEQPIDIDQIHELHRMAFGRPAEAELVDAIRSGSDYFPDLSLVAVAGDGSVLGHVLVSRVGFEPDGGGPRVDVLALAPLAVLPPHAGRGIGTALTIAALESTDARDEPFVVVLGPPAFYRRFGFGPADDHGIDSRYGDVGPAFQVRPRVEGGALAPGVVVYPPMFEAV